MAKVTFRNDLISAGKENNLTSAVELSDTVECELKNGLTATIMDINNRKVASVRRACRKAHRNLVNGRFKLKLLCFVKFDVKGDQVFLAFPPLSLVTKTSREFNLVLKNYLEERLGEILDVAVFVVYNGVAYVSYHPTARIIKRAILKATPLGIVALTKP